jgi:hypothetical protein
LRFHSRRQDEDLAFLEHIARFEAIERTQVFDGTALGLGDAEKGLALLHPVKTGNYDLLADLELGRFYYAVGHHQGTGAQSIEPGYRVHCVTL